MRFPAKVNAEARLKFEAQDRVDLDRFLGTLVNRRVVVDVEEFKEKRSNPQNARYWALMTVGARSLWGDPSMKNELHNEIAHLLIGLPPCPKTGLRRRQHTPKMNTQEFSGYMDLAADKLVELGADLSKWDDETKRIEAA